MPNYTLNPSVITGQLPQMPQIQGRATTSLGGINTTPIGMPQMADSVANGSNLWQMALSSFMNSNPIGSAINGAFGLLGGVLDRNFERQEAEKQRQWNEDMLDKQNEWSLDMWNKTNAYNTPAAQKARLQAAGLNPLYYGLDGSSANGLESAQALGYDRASAKGLINPLQQFSENYMNAAMQSKQIEAMDAQIDKTKSETEQNYLENEFLDKTMSARIQGVTLANDLTEQQINKIKEEIPEIRERVQLLIKQQDTELAKQFWYAMDTALKEHEIKRIVAMLPLEMELTKAKTAQARAAASLACVEAAYKQKLVDSGYIDAMIDEMNSRARKAGAEADILESNREVTEYLNTLKSGKSTSLSTWFNEHPNMKAALPAVAFLSGDMWRLFNDMKETGVFQMLSIIGAGYAIGARNKPRTTETTSTTKTNSRGSETYSTSTTY